MRTFAELVNKHERVWLYISGEKYLNDFLKKAIDAGFRYSNGSELSLKDKGVLWAIHKDLTVSHISMFIWCMTYKYVTPDSIIRIDYQKYIDGEEDYICHESPINIEKIRIN